MEEKNEIRLQNYLHKYAHKKGGGDIEDILPKQKKQHEIEIGGVHIQFPYRPYKAQENYMREVIRACKTGSNALLESPTGTGKTLALLCASLSWLNVHNESQDEIQPKIIYLSRTHSQLSQIIKELRKTVYRPKTVTLGSRDQLCINEEAKKKSGTLLSIYCKKLCYQLSCPFTTKLENSASILKCFMDLEELALCGKEAHFCPFYVARSLIPEANLLLMPYNYLLNPKIRKIFSEFYFQNSIIIFDEAHNVPKAAEEASSFQTSIYEMSKSIQELYSLKKIIKDWDKKNGDMSSSTEKKPVNNYINELFIPINNFLGYLMKESTPSNDGTVIEGKKLFDIFQEGTSFTHDDTPLWQGFINIDHKKKISGITLENHKDYMEKVDQCCEMLAEKNLGNYLLEWKSVIETVYYYLKMQKQNQQFSSVTKSIEFIDDFKIVLCNDSEDLPQIKKHLESWKISNKTLKFLCFNPGIAFLNIIESEPLSIILTSGTLSPMHVMEKELRIPFQIKLENSHVVEKSQVLVQYVNEFAPDSKFNFTYKKRNDDRQLEHLLDFIYKIGGIANGGVLVFFSCYSMIEKCSYKWKAKFFAKSNISLFSEKHSSTENQQMLQDYRKQIACGRKAVLLAVCRGKISEGLDFTDQDARAVIVVGIPFSSKTDKRVILKQAYLKEHIDKLKLSGSKWYTQEAIRAVNQAIGRVIRHSKDYGAIFLVDEQYTYSNFNIILSKWIKDFCPPKATMTKSLEDAARFFRLHTTKIEEEKQAKFDPPSLSESLSEEESVVMPITVKIQEITNPQTTTIMEKTKPQTTTIMEKTKLQTTTIMEKTKPQTTTIMEKTKPQTTTIMEKTKPQTKTTKAKTKPQTTTTKGKTLLDYFQINKQSASLKRSAENDPLEYSPTRIQNEEKKDSLIHIPSRPISRSNSISSEDNIGLLSDDMDSDIQDQIVYAQTGKLWKVAMYREMRDNFKEYFDDSSDEQNDDIDSERLFSPYRRIIN